MTKNNVYGGFSQALFFSGSVSIPKFLLDHYAELGISDREMMLLIHLIAELNAENSDRLEENIGRKMGINISEVKEILVDLQSKGILSSSQEIFNRNKISVNNKYDITGLIDQLFELWGISQFKQITAVKSDDFNKNVNSSKANPPMEIIEVFERELGRPLSEFECEHIEKWLIASYSEELILEALRRGVSAGIRNFRYLDSILREWEKKGIKTLLEVKAEDENFQSRQKKKDRGKKKNVSPNKYDDIYL
ncbi:MAG: DnaD domain protein [Peptococcaceae bacterium]|mgnify:CR=1 FL=1|nr:DnaD domain protein [Peptococcaceae bacterium]